MSSNARLIQSDAGLRVVASHKLIDDFDESQTLYHFTSQEGLLNIIKDGFLRCTSLTYMNDATEIEYGKQVAINLLSDIRNSDDFNSNLSRTLIDLFCNDVSQLISNFQPDMFYCTCFTTEENLASVKHWNDYANNGTGCCIGFNIKPFIPSYNFFTAGSFIKYNTNAHKKMCIDLFQHIMDGYFSENTDPFEWNSAVYLLFCSRIPFMKNPADQYKEEREFRIITMKQLACSAEIRHYERTAPITISIPFYELRSHDMDQLPIKTITLGSKCSLLESDVHALLDDKGYKNVKIDRQNQLPDNR